MHVRQREKIVRWGGKKALGQQKQVQQRRSMEHIAGKRGDRWAWPGLPGDYPPSEGRGIVREGCKRGMQDEVAVVIEVALLSAPDENTESSAVR